jgi:hypothetical protein
MAKEVFSAKNIFMILFFAIAAIYLFGVLTDDVACTPSDLDDPATTKDESQHGCTVVDSEYLSFVIPGSGELETSSLWIMKIAFLGIVLFIGYGVVMKLNSFQFSRKHLFTLVLLGVALYFMWTYIIVPLNLLGATNFLEISWKGAKKIGLMP